MKNQQKIYCDNIGKIINEEVQQILNESYVYEGDDFKFKQRITNSSFYNYEGFSNDYDVNISQSDIYISWHVGFWLNDSGIEHFYAGVDGVEGTYHIEYLNKQTDEIEQEADKNIAEFQWKFVIEDTALHLNKTLYIESLDFDFKTKTCRVVFYDYENKLK